MAVIGNCWRSILVLMMVAFLQVTGKPPHIIFIVADDLGWNDVGWHNPNMYTPNLDKLAMDGIRLNSSYVQQVCSPSRNCFMSGYYPYHTGLQHDVIRPNHPAFMPANITTLPQKLKELGYRTHMAGNYVLLSDGGKNATEPGKDRYRADDDTERIDMRFYACQYHHIATEAEGTWVSNTHDWEHGVIHEGRPGYMPANITTLPQKLREMGYTTHIVGKWHLGFCNWKYTPTFRGFDSFMGYYVGAEDYFTHRRDDGYDFRWNTSVYNEVAGEYSANIIADHAINLINTIDPESQPLYLYLPFQSVHDPLQNVIARHAVNLINTLDPESQPLYMYLPFQSVHGPLEVPERYKNLPPYKHIQHKNRRTYCGMVSALDEAVGNITEALKKRGFWKNALIVFTTDNGGPTYIAANNLPLRGAKTTLWEGGTKGAAFVYSETLFKKTKYVNTEIIHAVDWFPTLLAAAGGTPDLAMDGKNQWGMISEGQPSARNEFVYNIDELANCSAIRVDNYKLIQGKPGSHNGWAPVPTAEYDNEPRPEYSGPQQFPPYQLFDLKVDPTEHFDIADKHPDIVEKLKKRLAEYRKSLVPANFPAPDPKADPKYYGGNWSPGWC